MKKTKDFAITQKRFVNLITRFPPSNTGPIHLANLRTALYNFLLTKKYKGTFYLRMEDTDTARSERQYEREIIEMLQWFKIDIENFTELKDKGTKFLNSESDLDEFTKGIFRQSERLEIYKKKAIELYNKGYLYYCQCDQNPCICENKGYTEGALRFKIPKNKELNFTDEVCGKQKINSNALENFVVLRKDGWPTYNFVVVVDDMLKGVTLVARGKDHLTNTFKQLLVYEALGGKSPMYAHFPLILGEDGKKLSKRNGNASAKYYKTKGYAMEAVRNTILRTGFGYKNKEEFSLEEAIDLFSLEKVSVSSGKFNQKKLFKQSRKYLRNMEEKYIPLLRKRITYEPNEPINSLVYQSLVKRFDNLQDMASYINTLEKKPKIFTDNEMLLTIKDWVWKPEDLQQHLRGLTKEEKAQLRFVLTGSQKSIDLVALLLYLGQQEVCNRLIK